MDSRPSQRTSKGKARSMLSVHKNAQHFIAQYTLNFHQYTKTFGLESIKKYFKGRILFQGKKCRVTFQKLHGKMVFGSAISTQPLYSKLMGKMLKGNIIRGRSPHCYFTRLNVKKMGPLQFCPPALLRIHRHPMQKEFLKSCEGFLRATLTVHGHSGPV